MTGSIANVLDADGETTFQDTVGSESVVLGWLGFLCQSNLYEICDRSSVSRRNYQLVNEFRFFCEQLTNTSAASKRLMVV